MTVTFNKNFVQGAKAQASGLEAQAKQGQVYVMDRMSAEKSLTTLDQMKAKTPEQKKLLSSAINALTKAIQHATDVEQSQPTGGPRPRDMPLTMANPNVRPRDMPLTMANPNVRPHDQPLTMANPNVRPHDRPLTMANPNVRPRDMPLTMANPNVRPRDRPLTMANPNVRPHDQPLTMANPNVRPHDRPLTMANPNARGDDMPLTMANPNVRTRPGGPAVGFLVGVAPKQGAYKVSDLKKLRGNDVVMVPPGTEISISRLGTKSITVGKDGPFSVRDGKNARSPQLIIAADDSVPRRQDPTLVKVKYYEGTKLETLTFRVMQGTAAGVR